MADSRKEFSKIYDKYIEKIYRFVYLKVSSEDIAQDICSETFLKGWTAFDSKKQEIENPSAFLYQIARNLIIDHYREKGKVQFVSVEENPVIDPNPGLEEKMLLSSDLEQIKASLTNLKEDYQNVIIWHYLDDLSIPEIAKMLGRTEDTCRVLLHRALKSLKKEIKEV